MLFLIFSKLNSRQFNISLIFLSKSQFPYPCSFTLKKAESNSWAWGGFTESGGRAVNWGKGLGLVNWKLWIGGRGVRGLESLGECSLLSLLEFFYYFFCYYC